jgi:hypothetical protein
MAVASRPGRTQDAAEPRFAGGDGAPLPTRPRERLARGDHGAQPEVLLGFSEPMDGQTMLGQSLFGTRQPADALVVLHR